MEYKWQVKRLTRGVIRASYKLNNTPFSRIVIRNTGTTPKQQARTKPLKRDPSEVASRSRPENVEKMCKYFFLKSLKGCFVDIYTITVPPFFFLLRIFALHGALMLVHYLPIPEQKMAASVRNIHLCHTCRPCQNTGHRTQNGSTHGPIFAAMKLDQDYWKLLCLS